MKYLFFDMEFATSKFGGKICEFGYVIINENFNIIEKNNFIINPNIDNNMWDKRVLNKLLTRKQEEYENSEKFEYYYPHIKKIIESADYIFGHSINNDVRILNSELKSRGYKSLIFDFYDIKEFYKKCENKKEDVSLENMMKNLCIELQVKNHDALDDSFSTMNIFKELMKKFNLSISNVFEFCPQMKYNTSNYKIKRICKPIKENYRKKNLKRILSTIKRTNYTSDELNNKKIYISYEFTKNHYKETEKLVQIIYNKGGEVVLKVEDCNLFVDFVDEVCINGVIMKPMKVKAVTKILNENKNIKKMEFFSFLDSLSIDKNIFFENLNLKENINEIDYDKNKVKPLVVTFGDYLKIME